MIKCEVCGREHDDAFRFCLDCGAPLAAPGGETPIPLTRKVQTGVAMRPCPRCGEPVAAHHAFCGACGNPMKTAPAAGSTKMMHSTGAPAVTAPRFALTPIGPDGAEGSPFDVGEGGVAVGRHQGTITLPDDPFVAEQHARFTADGGALVVEDLGSASGTWMRLASAEPVRLSPGASLRLGHQRLDLEAVAPAATGDGPREWGSPDPGFLLRFLQRLEGGAAGLAWPLTEGVYQLGREEGDLVFPGDGYISGRHATITVTAAGELTYEDVGSSNGSYLRITEPTRLAASDLVLVGTHLLRVDAV